MNSVQKANQTYYSKNKDRLIQMSLKYYYENKDTILPQSKTKAKTYYYKIKYTPKYFRKLLLASVRVKIKLKLKCFLKQIFQAWRDLVPVVVSFDTSKVVDKIVVSFD